MRAKRAHKILGHAHLLTGKVKVQIVTDHVLNVASELVQDFQPNEISICLLSYIFVADDGLE